MTPYDNQLKAVLAKMLPEKIDKVNGAIAWRDTLYEISTSELLHVCHLIEQGLSDSDHADFSLVLYDGAFVEATKNFDARSIYSPTWQQRTTALAKVKGIEL